MSSQPSEWASIIAADGFAQISTTGKKVKTKDCEPTGKYPVIDQGQEKVAGYVDDPEKLISAAEPLIVFGDHTRAVKWVDFSFVPGADGTKILQPRPYLLPRFAYYQLGSLEIPNKGYSRHFKFLKELEFVVPPFAEQKVIADKLDTLLAQVENTKARLESIPQILKRFRQSVLAAAVSGRLTEEWRQNFKNETIPDQLVRGEHQVDDEYQIQVPSSWQLTAMGNVSSFQQGLQIAKSTRRMAPGEGVLPILRTVNYEKGFNSDVHYAMVDDKSIIAEPEDIILSRTGTVGMVLTGYRGVMHNNSFRINFQKELLSRSYMIYYLKSPLCQEYIKKESGRSSQPDLTHKAFSKCPVTVPGILEQTEIVRRVDQLFSHADRIEQQVKDALARVTNLTQSILAKAFRGELTEKWREYNPELISGENSAEALLERIQAERASQKPAGRRTKPKKSEPAAT